MGSSSGWPSATARRRRRGRRRERPAATPAKPPRAAAAPTSPPHGRSRRRRRARRHLAPVRRRVTIDGAAAGATPLSTHVAAGQHAIAVAKERYATATTSIDAPGKLALDLRRPSATLHVTSTPPAADVIIAGEHRGKTPVDVKLPGFESYDVRVALAGARPWRKTIYLGHALNRVDAALARRQAPRRRR